MGVSSMYVADSASIADGAVSEAKLAAQACSAAKHKNEGNAGEVLTSNGAGSAPSYQPTGVAGAGGGSPMYIIPHTPQAVVQGTWAYSNGATYYGAGYMQNSATRAVNDEITYQAFLAAGTYVLELVCYTGATCGIVTLSIDGSAATTIDMYSAGGTQNVNKRSGGFAVAAGGLKTLSFKMASKNASATYYEAFFSGIILRRTA